jgi:internalin A
MSISLSEKQLSELTLSALPNIALEEVTVFSAYNNDLKVIPDWFFFTFKSLEELHLDHNQLQILLPSISFCRSLRILSLHDNRLAFVPEEIGLLIHLEELRLDRNCLRSLPDSICQCNSLQLIHIDGNEELDSLPESLGMLSNLKDFGIGYCPKLSTLPTSLNLLEQLSIWIYAPSSLEAMIPPEILYDPSPGVITSALRNYI